MDNWVRIHWTRFPEVYISPIHSPILHLTLAISFSVYATSLLGGLGRKWKPLGQPASQRCCPWSRENGTRAKRRRDFLLILWMGKSHREVIAVILILDFFDVKATVSNRDAALLAPSKPGLAAMPGSCTPAKHRITESQGLGGTSGDHQVQPTLLKASSLQ